MSVLSHRASLLVAALEAGELDFALRVARRHADDLRALLTPVELEEGLDDLDGLAEADAGVTTAQPQAPRVGQVTQATVPPTFAISVAGAFESGVGVGVSVSAPTLKDERRLWTWLLNHPVVGEPLRELLARVDWTDDAAPEVRRDP